MRITDNMSTLNNFNNTSSKLRDVLSSSNDTHIQINSKIESISNNSNQQTSKAEYSSTEKQQILSSLQRDLNPSSISTNDMMKSITESPKTVTLSSTLNDIAPQIKPLENEAIIVKTTNSEKNIVDFDTQDENEILVSDYKPTSNETSSSKSIAEFLKNSNFDESSYFSDTDFFG